MSTIQPLSAVRRSHIQQVLRHAKGDLDLASRILGISTEDLCRLLASHGLDPAREVGFSPANHEEE